ncbi:hypothetical protein ABVT39_021129 [Epinephelus coioides]
MGNLSLVKAVPENVPDFDTDWVENTRSLKHQLLRQSVNASPEKTSYDVRTLSGGTTRRSSINNNLEAAKRREEETSGRVKWYAVYELIDFV